MLRRRIHDEQTHRDFKRFHFQTHSPRFECMRRGGGERRSGATPAHLRSQASITNAACVSMQGFQAGPEGGKEPLRLPMGCFSSQGQRVGERGRTPANRSQAGCKARSQAGCRAASQPSRKHAGQPRGGSPSPRSRRCRGATRRTGRRRGRRQHAPPPAARPTRLCRERQTGWCAQGG